jgi:hypothetical protein
VSGGWTLLPPAPDACQVCAVKHLPEEPHDPQSLYWATARSLKGEPPPTWEDALEHVEPELRARWIELLAEHGVKVQA